MTDTVAQAVAPFLPLRLETVEYNDPLVVVSGSGWSLSITCAWRLVRDGRLWTSGGQVGAELAVRELVGMRIIDVLTPRGDVGGDIRVILDQRSALDVFVDTDYDPWVFRLPDATFVGMF